MMLCSGGGARCDYEALKYFTEFWCSDNTDPVERLYIQWGFSHFFPAKAMCAHVTSWNRRGVDQVPHRRRLDVQAGIRPGVEGAERRRTALLPAGGGQLEPVATVLYSTASQYRLVSPYESNHMAVNYVEGRRPTRPCSSPTTSIPRYQEKLLHREAARASTPTSATRIEEINLMPGVASALPANGKELSGDYLMKVGLDVLGFTPMRESRGIELTAVK